MGRPITYHDRLDRFGVPRLAIGGRSMGYDERINWLIQRAMPDGQNIAHGNWLPPGDHFVVIVENDSGRAKRYEWDAFGIPHVAPGCEYEGETITFEHYLGKNTTAEQVKAHAAMLRGRYGRVAVAKLVIVEADK
jgi:hypothetical protein